jgi:hypothetical protein
MSHSAAPSLYRSPQEAMQAPPEEFLYLACLREGTGVDAPDFLAVVDTEDGRIIHELPMSTPGDELHHFGWNRCSSACHGPDRSHLIIPGFRSSRIHVVNVADDPRKPRLETVIEPDEVVAKTGYTRPHTVHCMPGNAYEPGFDLEDVAAGRYGSRLHFWNLAERTLEQSLDLGENGLVPLEARWLHDPDADEGFVGAALSSTMWHFHRDNGSWTADQVIAVESVPLEGWPFPVPGLITDLVLSMDDRSLYLANWLHGDVRRYDVSDPSQPKLTGQVWLGGVIGKSTDARRELSGGPNMLQLSYDGRRLYVTNSLYSTWDNQFYPELRSWLLRIDCDPNGGMEIDHGFFVDFHDRPDGPARAHEVRLQGGDCTTEIFQ